MHRIDGLGHVGNRFSEGNPVLGQRATKVTAAWLNDVQENLLTFLKQAGIEPIKGKEDQLYLAVVALITSAVQGLGAGAAAPVPITRQISTAGLLEGGGTLANNLALSVPKATPAEVAAGVADNRAVTPQALALAFSGSFFANGYGLQPGGLILQWGRGTVAGNANTNLTLPTTFPNACLFAAVEGGSTGDKQDNNPYVSGTGLSVLSVFNARDFAVSVNFLAIGF